MITINLICVVAEIFLIRIYKFKQRQKRRKIRMIIINSLKRGFKSYPNFRN
ncbi:MAG: hypothetical protein DRP35_01740 [Candidatus Zixiibacteriota bacterium]|nr:MAG: hypothetical protein DRP35_01740 [candidate division Zixibacteria bacterium]